MADAPWTYKKTPFESELERQLPSAFLGLFRQLAKDGESWNDEQIEAFLSSLRSAFIVAWGKK